MNKLIALCALILISTGAMAMELPRLPSQSSMSAEALLDSYQDFSPAPSNERKALAATGSAQVQFGNKGWASPLPLSRPATEAEGRTAPAPEPAIFLLLGAGLIGLAGIARRGLPH